MDPLYRVIADAAVINGTLYTKGAVVKFEGWPKKRFEMEPANDGAKRIADYLVTYGGDPQLPATPYNSLIGGIFLPAVLPGRDPPPYRANPDLPCYKMRRVGRSDTARTRRLPLPPWAGRKTISSPSMMPLKR
jgi:hypothetical protein